MLQRPIGNRVFSWWHLKQRTDRLRRIWTPTLLRSPPKKRTLKKASLTSPKCSPVSTTTTHDPATGTHWAMPKHPGTGHSVYFPTGDYCFPGVKSRCQSNSRASQVPKRCRANLDLNQSYRG